MFFQTYSGLSYKVKIHWSHLSATFLPHTTLAECPPTQSEATVLVRLREREGQKQGQSSVGRTPKSVNRFCPSHCSPLGHNFFHSQKEIGGKCLWLAEHRVPQQVIRGFLFSAFPPPPFFFLCKKHLVVPLKIRLKGLHVNIRFLGYTCCYVGYTHSAALETQCQ